MAEPTPALNSPEQLVDQLAFLASMSSTLRLQVREDKCFDRAWLDIGTVAVYPDVAGYGDTHQEVLQRSVHYGQYTWHVPTLAKLEADLTSVMGTDPPLGPVAEALQDAARRLCLLLPTFDPETHSL